MSSVSRLPSPTSRTRLRPSNPPFASPYLYVRCRWEGVLRSEYFMGDHPMGTAWGTAALARVGLLCESLCVRSAMLRRRATHDTSYTGCRALALGLDGSSSQHQGEHFPSPDKEQPMAAEEREDRDMNRDPI